MEYTKGEWELEIHDEDNATIHLPNGEVEIFGDNAKANAQLIASAPRLHKTLGWLKSWLFQATQQKEDWWDLERVIAEIQVAYEIAEETLTKVKSE